MTSQVDIINRALVLVGQNITVSSVNPSDGSVAANVASLIYQPMLETLLRESYYDFARKVTQLTLLKTAAGTTPWTEASPPPPWQYEYAYPSDCVQIRQLVPQNATLSYSPENVNFVVSNDVVGNSTEKVILTNQINALCYYTQLVEDPDLWDSIFTEAFVSALAARLAVGLSGKPGMSKVITGDTAGILSIAGKKTS